MLSALFSLAKPAASALGRTPDQRYRISGIMTILAEMTAGTTISGRDLLPGLNLMTSSSTTVEMQTSSSTSWNPLLPTMAWPACWISMTSPDLLARITWLISTAGLIFRVPELPERGTATSCSFPEQSKSPKKRCSHVRIFCLKRVQRLRRRNMDAVPD